MTVVGRSSRTSVRPTIWGSAPNRRRQSPSLRSTTAGRPGRSSSAREAATERGRHAQQRDRIGGDVSRVEPLGSAAAGQRERAVAEGGEAAERSIALTKVPVLGRAELLAGYAVELGMHHHHLGRPLVRQRAQEHAVHHAEDRRGGADAERERGHGERGEGRTTAQAPEGLPEIVAERVDHSDLSATTGSIRLARRAGMAQATAAAPSRMRATSAKVRGSCGFTS